MFSPLTKNIGIDLGTSTTQVYVEGRGVLMSEPSILATDEGNRKIIAVGHAAESLLANLLKLLNYIDHFRMASLQIIT